jgi:hypothetical protein
MLHPHNDNWRLTGPILGAEPRNALQTGIILMAIHKQILEWQADHPTIT